MTDPGHLTDEETPDTVGAYPRLSEHQITALGAFGETRPATGFIVVTGFLDPRWLVEIEADAIVDR